MGSGVEELSVQVSLYRALDLLCQAAAFKSPDSHVGSHCWHTHGFLSASSSCLASLEAPDKG